MFPLLPGSKYDTRLGPVAKKWDIISSSSTIETVLAIKIPFQRIQPTIVTSSINDHHRSAGKKEKKKKNTSAKLLERALRERKTCERMWHRKWHQNGKSFRQLKATQEDSLSGCWNVMPLHFIIASARDMATQKNSTNRRNGTNAWECLSRVQLFWVSPKKTWNNAKHWGKIYFRYKILGDAMYYNTRCIQTLSAHAQNT